MNRLSFATILALSVIAGCNRGKDAGASGKDSSSAKPRPSFAFITNGVAGFWEHARAGANAAGNDLGVDVVVITPSNLTDQTRKIEDLLTRGIDGIAISAIDPKNQADIINKAAEQTIVISHDSDAPQTKRQLYIGMDNYRAGLMCGKTLRAAMPNGGKVMIFIGRLDQDNAERRCRGFVDAFVGRSPDPNRSDPLVTEVASDDKKFQIIGTMTDQFDRAKAKANVEDAMTRNPDLAGMVGLFEYNPPMILEALDRMGKLGQIKVMGFDENAATLQGIKDGTVVATVVQNPYEYGYQSIRILNELHKGNASVIPESKFIDIPARVIDKSNVDAFSKEINDRLGKKDAA